jgi:hypothetical protein
LRRKEPPKKSWTSATAAATAASALTLASGAGAATGLSVRPATLPNAIAGTAYSRTITATGGTEPYTVALTDGTLPAGLTLSSGGVLGGTPAAAAPPSKFVVTATDAAGSHATGSRSYTVGVDLRVSPQALADGVVGAA